MKVFYTSIINWISALELLFVINGIFAQEGATLDNLIVLCNERQISNCEWLENYKQQHVLNELIFKLNEGDRNYQRYPSHTYPRFALYDQSKNISPFPFARSWKSRTSRIPWNKGNQLEKLQSRIPFNYDNKRGQNTFSSWGGKRNREPRQDVMNNKREPVFSSWGGKRTQKFFNWGGKRNINDNEIVDVTDNSNHNIMKRNAKAELNNKPLENRLCIADETDLQQLFKEFIEWSRKHEQKKGPTYRNMFGVSALRSPDNLSRRGSFFQWGGKRNTKNN